MAVNADEIGVIPGHGLQALRASHCAPVSACSARRRMASCAAPGGRTFASSRSRVACWIRRSSSSPRASLPVPRREWRFGLGKVVVGRQRRFLPGCPTRTTENNAWVDSVRGRSAAVHVGLLCWPRFSTHRF
jgi:hypothetical protein